MKRSDREKDRAHERTEEIDTEFRTHREAFAKGSLTPAVKEAISHSFTAEGYKLSNILLLLLSPSVTSLAASIILLSLTAFDSTSVVPVFLTI